MALHLRKIRDIAFKDLLRSFRSTFALVMMFIAPLLMTGIFHFAFGGLASDGGSFDIPLTRVQIVNLDQPAPQFGGSSAGQMLVDFLQDDTLSSLLHVTEAADEASARTAVENQVADVAIIVPGDFTAAVLTPESYAALTLVQDPTLTLGPSIVKGLVSQLVDGFAGTKIAVSVTADQLGKWGTTADAHIIQSVVAKYVEWVTVQGESRGEGRYPALDIQPPPGKAESEGQPDKLVALVMVGMMIFFAFFTGASTAGSIIREDEEGTLARLFTTPTLRTAILAGKLIAVFVMVFVQVIVLMFLSAIIFGIYWGELPVAGLVTLGLVIAASGFGVFVMSFIRSTRQESPVIGGVLTLTGMAGGLFTTGIQDLPAFYETINLLTPHGWALRAWNLALAGGGVGDVLLSAAVLLGMGIAFFAIGALGFRKRFA